MSRGSSGERGDEGACRRVLERLVDGARASDDVEVGEHVGSCLTCFRVAADMRDLPRIAALLGAESPRPAVFDPGERFWASFPARVTEAWQAQRRGAEGGAGAASEVAPAPALAAAEPPRGAWQRFVDFFRLPVPAALAGAAVAGLVVYAALRAPAGSGQRAAEIVAGQAARPTGAVRPAPEGAAVAVASDPAPSAFGQDDVALAGDLDEELLRDLDVADLETLLDGMSGRVAAAPRRAGGDADAEIEEDLDEAFLGLDATESVADEIERLDVGALRALKRSLGRSI
jgi:hypothetical protein